MPSDSPAAAPALSPALTRAEVSDPAPANTPAAAHDPLCPRCGYDLRGQAPTTPHAPATDATTTGTCAECGLTFPWREVLDPDLASPRWFIESRAGSWRLIRTFVRAAIPPRFFSDVQGVRLTTLGRIWPRLRFMLAATLLLISIAWITPLLLSLAFKATHTPPLMPFWGGTFPRLYEAYHLWPLGDVLGPPVINLYRDLMARGGRGLWTSPATFNTSREYAYLLWLCIAWVLLTPTGLLVLRTTRRICRINTSHIARAATYSTGPAALLITITFGLAWTGLVHDRTLPWKSPQYGSGSWWSAPLRFLADYTALLIPLLALWLFWWWRTAIHRYMKMPSATGIAAAIVTMGFLAAAVILTTLAAPGPTQELGDRLNDWFR